MATEQQSTAGAAVAQVQEKGGQAVAKAQEVLGGPAQSAKTQAADRVRQEVDRRSTQAGEQAQTLAGTMRRAADQLREQGEDRQAGVAEQAADRVERAAGYLRDSDADRILGDVETFARRRPWLVGVAAAGIGFLAARFLTASSERRYEQRGDGSGSADSRRSASGAPDAQSHRGAPRAALDEGHGEFGAA